MSDDRAMDLLERTIGQETIDIPAGKLTRDRIDRGRFRRITMERNARGAKALKGFAEFLIRDRGVRPVRAMAIRALAWALYEETQGNPAGLLYQPYWLESSTYNGISRARGAIKHIADWLLTASTHAADHEWAREQIRLVISAPQTARGPRAPYLPKGDREWDPPATDQEIERLLEVVDRKSIAARTKWPWMRHLMRIMILTGTGPAEIVRIARRDMSAAVLGQSAKRAWISVRHTNARRPNATRLIPVLPIEDEVKRLLAWPHQWSIIADILSPIDDPAAALESGAHKLVAAFGRMAKEAWGEVEPGTGPRRASGYYWRRTKHWAWTKFFEAKPDWVLLAQFTGCRLPELRRITWLREMEHRRFTGTSPLSSI